MGWRRGFCGKRKSGRGNDDNVRGSKDSDWNQVSGDGVDEFKEN